MRTVANRIVTLVFTRHRGSLLEHLGDRYGGILPLSASFYARPFLWVRQRTKVIIAVVRICRPPSAPVGSIALEPHAASGRWHATWDIPLESPG